MRVIAVMVFALFAILVLRLWSLQVIERRHYAQAAIATTLRPVTVPPPRGLIVSRNDTVLAGNKVENELVLTRSAVQTDPNIVGKVAALAGVSPTAVDTALANDQYSLYQPVPILQNASSAVVEYLDEHKAQFPGVSVEQVTVRDYPQGGTLATHILGYTGPITATYLKTHANQGYSLASVVGKTGIELQEEKYLRGVPGRQTLEVTPTGTVVGVKRQTSPVQGDTVVLNLTATLQKVATSALTAAMVADRARTTGGLHPKAPNGAAIVMNAKTGAILAMTSLPTYSLTEWVGGITTANYNALSAGCTLSTGGCPLNNYAIQGLYTPGSTFKLATATAALQDGLITPTTIIHDTGVFNVRTHGDPTCTGPHCVLHDATASDAGYITIRLALTESDDFFFYTLGLHFWLDRHQFGNTAIQDEAHKYGLGVSTGIDLPNEVTGRVDSQPVREALHKQAPKAFPTTAWYPGTNIEMAFGQGGTVITPIELADAYATFADGGVRHQPQVVGAVVTPKGKMVERIAPKVTGHVTISPSNYTAMLQGFEGVTHNPKGTAYAIFQQYSHVPATYIIAGKTGSATTATTRIRRPNALFVGFGPVGQATQYVVVAAVAQGGYGDQGAAPAVANIFNYLAVHPPASNLRLPTPTRQPTVTLPTKTTKKSGHKSTTTPPTTAAPPSTTTTTTSPTTTTTSPTTTTTSPTTTTTAPPSTTTTTAPPSTTTTAPPSTTTTTAPPSTTTTPPATTTTSPSGGTRRAAAEAVRAPP